LHDCTYHFYFNVLPCVLLLKTMSLKQIQTKDLFHTFFTGTMLGHFQLYNFTHLFYFISIICMLRSVSLKHIHKYERNDILLWCDALETCRKTPTSLRNILSPSSAQRWRRHYIPLKHIYLSIQRHNPEDKHCDPCCCKNLRLNILSVNVMRSGVVMSVAVCGTVYELKCFCALRELLIELSHEYLIFVCNKNPA
jgi:hypothetical protein